MSGLPQNADIDSALSSATVGRNTPGVLPFGPTLRVRYLVDQGAVSLILPDKTITYTQADAQDSNRDTVAYFVKTDGDGKLASTFLIEAPSVGGVTMSYVRWGTFYSLLTPGQAAVDKAAIFVFGVPTENAQMPRTGSGTYTLALSGAIVEKNGDVFGTSYAIDTAASHGTLTADFSALSVVSTLFLSGRTLSGSTVRDFGSIEGGAAISATDSSYLGSFTTNGVTGEFSGAFFGPGAVETGYTFFANSQEFQTSGLAAGAMAPPPPP